MIQTKRRLWFRSVFISLEDSRIPSILETGRYDAVSVLSYANLTLPGFRVVAKTTACIDLTPPEEIIFSRMHDTTRNEIRRSYKIEDLAISGPEPVADDVYAMYSSFEWGQHRVPIARKEMSLFPTMVARYKGKPVAAITMIEAKPFLRIRSIFSARLSADKDAKKIIGYASRRVMWEWCRWGKMNGFEKLDVASVNLVDKNKKGISDFKMSFGGSIGMEYLYVWKSAWYAMFESGAAFKNAMRRAYQRFTPPPPTSKVRIELTNPICALLQRFEWRSAWSLAGSVSYTPKTARVSLVPSLR